ncbi:MAG: BlaI/MecI/CopY family transcriptional regulator [Bacteroidales bacterium]|nr:BlaI/MecI/CopY family transcriptional regulator [Bacteroidales bacterium]
MKELTRAEEEVMQILWKEKKAFVKEILTNFPDPKPAYNTVSTIVRILEKKGFVSHEEYGKSHRYYPLIDKESYREARFSDLMKGYFNNSMKQVLSHFSDADKLNLREADELIQLLEEIKNKSKTK